MPPATPEYCFLWINHWSTCMQKAEWSGWAQAVVSTLAVAFAAAGIWWQVKTQAKLQRDQIVREEIRLLKVVGQFVFEVRAKLRLIGEEDMPHKHENWTSIEAPVQSIRGVAFERYPLESTAFAVASALLSYDFMRAAYRKIGTSFGTSEEVEHIEKSREHTLACFFRAENEIDQALIARHSHLPRMQIDFGDGIAIRTLEAEPLFA